MNHTCSAVAALLSTASPLPLAPAGPCSWDSSCAQLLRFPGLRRLPGPGGSPRHGVPRAGMLPQLIVPGLGSAGGRRAEPPHRAGNAVQTTLLLPKCFPNSNRCPCFLRRISIRDFIVESGKLRHGEGVQVRQTSPWLSHPSPCVCLSDGQDIGAFPHQDHKFSALGATVTLIQLHPSHGMGTRPTLLPQPCPAPGPSGQDQGSAQPSLRGSTSAAAQHQDRQGWQGWHRWHLPRLSPHAEGTRGTGHGLERQPQHREGIVS